MRPSGIWTRIHCGAFLSSAVRSFLFFFRSRSSRRSTFGSSLMSSQSGSGVPDGLIIGGSSVDSSSYRAASLKCASVWSNGERFVAMQIGFPLSLPLIHWWYVDEINLCLCNHGLPSYAWYGTSEFTTWDRVRATIGPTLKTSCICSIVYSAAPPKSVTLIGAP